MTSQRTLRQFYQRFKEEHALLLAGQCDDSLCVTMNVLRVMYSYFLQHGTGQKQRVLQELKARPELAGLGAFLDEYRWQIDDQQGEYCVQPDVLGYVFEQQINQKQIGAYYTHGDVAEYLVQRTVLPYLLNVVTDVYPAVIAPLQARLLRTQPERYIHDVVSCPTYLPTETEREYALRQARYKQLYTLLQQGQIRSVADMITHNLDIQRFVLDIIMTCTHPPLLLTFYRTLERMTILDPTCGTGAFLLAAMTMLAELYKACFQRMQQFVERWDEVEQGHPQGDAPPIDEATPTHWLYGRGIPLWVPLFSVPRCEIDTTCYAAFRTLLTCITAQGFGELLVNNLYGIEIMPEAVEVCIMRLSLTLVTNSVDDRTLVGTDVSRPRRISKCQEDVIHRSLQWNVCAGNALADTTWQVAFSNRCAGFDVIIGNPPFVEYNKMAHDAMISGGNRAYGNMYAEVVERSLSHCNTAHSYVGFVVPLSLCGGERFDRLRRTLHTNTSMLWLANFDIFPCRLFEGAYQRLTLLLGKRNGQSLCTYKTYVTSIQRWYTSERSTLLERIVYTQVRHRHREGVFPKLGSRLQEDIVQKMITIADTNMLSLLVSPVKTEYALYYQEATNTWMKATRHTPYYKKNGMVTRPRHGRFLYFKDERRASVVCALMNSSLFYLWFATYSDGFHLSHALVQSFPVPDKMCTDEQLLELARRLEEDIQKHAVYSTRNTRTGDRIEIEEYRMVCSKPLVDEIDRVLAKHYDFTSAEVDLILYYDNKYRMGRA